MPIGQWERTAGRNRHSLQQRRAIDVTVTHDRDREARRLQSRIGHDDAGRRCASERVRGTTHSPRRRRRAHRRRRRPARSSPSKRAERLRHDRRVAVGLDRASTYRLPPGMSRHSGVESSQSPTCTQFTPPDGTFVCTGCTMVSDPAWACTFTARVELTHVGDRDDFRSAGACRRHEPPFACRLHRRLSTSRHPARRSCCPR